MKKQNLILSAALAAVFSASTAFAEAEVTGKIVHESGFYSNAGSTIGDFGVTTYNGDAVGGNPYQGVTTTSTPSHAKRDAFKRETTAKIYIDGEADQLTDGATYHVELNLMKDGKGGTNYDSNESYTQRDALREAYVDSQVGDWSLRTGKQQVVWGTADGMKLLDMINPTDYSEMAQNQMEDSRIPVWMINAETTNVDGSEFQVIVSQPRENIFAGLNRGIDTSVRENSTAVSGAGNASLQDLTLNNGTDTGHAYIMKGPDTITGASNGFLNIVPDLGSIAGQFAYALGGSANGLGGASMEGFKVGNEYDAAGTTFASMTMAQMATAMGGALPAGFQTAVDNTWAGLVVQYTNAAGVQTALGLDGATKNDLMGSHMLEFGFQPLYNSNLANYSLVKTTGTKSKEASSAFEYMDKTTFRTFDAFVNAKSQYVYNMPKNGDVDLALRFKNTTKNGVNYSLNTSYNYDKNPIIDLSWRGDAGQKLDVHEVKTGFTNLGAASPLNADGSFGVGTVAANTTLQLVDMSAAGLTQAAKLANNDVGFYTAGNYGGSAGAGKEATLQFSQEVKRVKQIGGSFDTAIETAALGPVVIRGEALYTKDGYSPVMNKDRLAIGDLVGALQMVKADRFKFVLGADVTALTNMMISAQFIQDSNLDFVDNGNNYTTDYATMHLSNGFNKAVKDKNFYSLFFSKPFGASGEHRWNNITMLEEGLNGNGKWNRLDAEFSINDDTQATVEYNKYWGDANTQFGQLEKSSNVQVGFKYSF